ncbi:MAG: dTDP-4-dehydrorhamnose 3,5-epimerase [Bacteroidetes bacterium]|nr:dTDP-4-dehydrorhamnose 3,5-epimerase [Bacteroidota bacterium]
MKIEKNHIDGLLVIKPDVYEDPRGYFFESYNAEKFKQHGIDVTFLQDNESLSGKSVLRGLHFQVPPYAQGKLVRVVRGAVLDVAVDLRKSSPTYGQWASITLTEQNKWMYWIPPGFAHGFVTLEEKNIFFYKCTQVYHKESELGIAWDDPDLKIEWGVADPVISEKDKNGMKFREFISPF